MSYIGQEPTTTALTASKLYTLKAPTAIFLELAHFKISEEDVII